MPYTPPIIFYNNVLESTTSTVTATTETAGFPIENSYDWLDWTFWKATSTSVNIDIDKGSAGITVDTISILGHNFGTEDVSIRVYEDDNSGFTSATALCDVTAINDDDPFYILLTSGTERYNRISITSGAGPGTILYAAVICLGKRMTMPVGPEFTFDPDMQNIRTEKYANYSGQIVSSAVKYSERMMTVPFRRIAQSFVTSDLLPFLEDHYAAMKPFFFIPDPGDVFGTDKLYFLTAPTDPIIELPIWEDNVSFRNWTLRAQGVRQSKYR